MKAELSFTDDLIEHIADRIIEKLVPVIADHVYRDQDDDLLTPEELARELKVKKSLIYTWVNESKHSDDGIPFKKAGKFLRFSKKAVLKWMKSRKNG